MTHLYNTRLPISWHLSDTPRPYFSRIGAKSLDLRENFFQKVCVTGLTESGSGKTVTMTAIEQRILETEEWIVIRLNAERNMLESLVGKLYDNREFLAKFVDANLNLTKFGIGLNLGSKSPVADIESALEIMLKELKKKKKKLLVSVDEVSNTASMREFASSFQIMIREDLPIFMLMAGLYDNISDLRNEKNMTFLYQTPQYEMEPLNLTLSKFADLLQVF